jgi:excisionase family DNA binding protein
MTAEAAQGTTTISTLLTIPEAAAALRCHPQTIRNLLRAGKLRTVRIGTRHRIPMNAIEAFVAGGGAPSTGAH